MVAVRVFVWTFKKFIQAHKALVKRPFLANPLLGIIFGYGLLLTLSDVTHGGNIFTIVGVLLTLWGVGGAIQSWNRIDEARPRTAAMVMFFLFTLVGFSFAINIATDIFIWIGLFLFVIGLPPVNKRLMMADKAIKSVMGESKKDKDKKT